MRLRTIIIALLALAVVAPAAADERKFGLTSFEKIRVEGDYIVEVTDSTRVAAIATGTREALETLELQIRDRTLVIRRKQFGSWGNDDGVQSPVVIRITATGLQSASLNGGGSLLLRGIDGPRLSIYLSGPGRIDGEDLAVDNLSTSLRGAGSMALAGEARVYSAIVEGSGRMDARDLSANTLTLSNSGSAASRFTASRQAFITPRGIGRVEIFGPAPCKVRGNGTGNITCEHGPPLRDD